MAEQQLNQMINRVLQPVNPMAQQQQEAQEVLLQQVENNEIDQEEFE